MQVHTGMLLIVIHIEVWFSLAPKDLIQGERSVCADLFNHHTQ